MRPWDILDRLEAARFLRGFARICARPEPEYERTWSRTRGLLERGPYWKKRGVPERLEQFPITSFEDYEPAIRAAFERDRRSPFTDEPLLYWATSSGTTGARKVVPLTSSFCLQFGVALGAAESALLRKFPGLRSRTTYRVIPGSSGEKSPQGIDVGYVSCFYSRTDPSFERRSAAPIGLASLPGEYERWSVVYALAAELFGITAITSRAALWMLESIRTDADSILKRWREKRGEIPAGIRPPPLREDRYDHVRRVLAKPGWTAAELWPSLKLVSSWIGGPCAPNAQALSVRLGPGVALQDAAYAATEGSFTVLVDGPPGSGVVHPRGHLLEFLPVDSALDPARLLKPWELKPGSEYELFLTTQMGFVRYRIKDVVRCEGWYGRAPFIGFRRKSDRVLRLSAVAVGESEIVEACASAALALTDRMVFGPDPSWNGLVLWTGDPIEPAAVENMDRALQEISHPYGKARKANLVSPIVWARLPADHELFREIPLHAQSKSRYLLTRPRPD